MDELQGPLRRAQSGDLDAYAVLVARFQDMAVGYAYSRLGDFHLAQDAAQEAFIEAYLNLDRVYGPEAFPAWLRRIVFKHCDRITRRKRIVTVPLESDALAEAKDGDPVGAIEAQELSEAVHQAIDSLSAESRAAVALYYISDYSQREIGEFLGVRVSTVKSRLYRGRKQLRERMINMVEDNLRQHRPSKDEAFGAEVQKGLREVYVDRTGTSLIDGEKGELLYRGYSIHDLAEHSSFEETCYLLLHNRLPNRDELAGFDAQLKADRHLPEAVLTVVRGMVAAHPIDVLRTAVSAIGAASSNGAADAAIEQGVGLIAAAPTIVAAHARIRTGQEPLGPNEDLGHAANFLYMLSGKAPDPNDARLIDKDLVLHAEHGANTSSFAARVVASTGADIVAAITAAIAALKGPLHGGAAERVMRMAQEIGTEENVEAYVGRLMDGGGRVMGFGHAVYKTVDPRSALLRGDAESLGKRKGRPEWFSILSAVARTMEPYSSRGISPNVDLWSGAIYYLLDISEDLFSSMFALGRLPGWVAHATEQYAANTLIRPRLRYDGPVDLDYVPVEQRQ